MTFMVYKGTSAIHEVPVEEWPVAPPWRRFGGVPSPRSVPPETRGATFRPRADTVQLVNAAIHLRRPLLVTGKPGTGKSSLAYAIAHELQLGRVLTWPINSRSTLQQALYHYDAIGRLQEVSLHAKAGLATADLEVGQFVRLGPLGTALLPTRRPRVLLIDEIDKSDIDLPNDLLHVLEEGQFEIAELARAAEPTNRVRTCVGDGDDEVDIVQGRVTCCEFPIVVLTSNGEREFPGAFKRRCIRLDLPEPTEAELTSIVTAHLGPDVMEAARPVIAQFLRRQKDGDMATDQLLNAVRLAMSGGDVADASPLAKGVLRPLSGA